MVTIRFCIYNEISEKYKGKYAIRPPLLSFLVGRSNQLDSFARMLHFYCCFRRHPYQSHFRPYAYMPYAIDNMGVFGSIINVEDPLLLVL
jgi:hypothetical protein